MSYICEFSFKQFDTLYEALDLLINELYVYYDQDFGEVLEEIYNILSDFKKEYE